MTNISDLLNQKVQQYNNPHFINSDPVSIPHMFTRKEDIEISGFLTSIISWGRRTAIIKSAHKLMGLMDNSPYDFLINSHDVDLKRFAGFVYRTFNSDDCLFLISSLRNIYSHSNSLEAIATQAFNINHRMIDVVVGLRNAIIETPHLIRSEKHLANPLMDSASKRINMYLRWMVRQDDHGVDFGIWKDIPQSHLMCPLDVHSGNVARKLGLLTRKQNDWKAVEELTSKLRTFDKYDPVKYDFALFGMGVFEGLS
ncbi:MAG: TIGR02757 family protein [Bacteroidetes bacterium]|nr:TIGR02757 family protein [Bacteroidota bacterium]MBL6943003.1 TIGR02757 family protein [Bacteroidales bacterium]